MVCELWILVWNSGVELGSPFRGGDRAPDGVERRGKYNLYIVLFQQN